MPETKIIVLRMKQVIGTVVFIGACIILCFILFFVLKNQEKDTTDKDGKYHAGVYTKQIDMGDSTVNLKVTLDENQIKSIELDSLHDSIKTMYPLMEPAVEQISEQLAAGKEISEVEISEESRYTAQTLLDHIDEILKQQSIE